MIAIRFEKPGSPKHPKAYRVAGQEVVAERSLAWLEPFAQPGRAKDLPPRSQAEVDAAEQGALIFDGEAFLARRLRQLTCHHFRWGFLFDVEGLGSFRFVEAESSLEVQSSVPGAEPELLEEVLLGPLLALALARRGIFLLHAAACELEGKVFLLLGESGAGKSTLAARLGGKLADDQAAIDAETLELLPDFPQPKMESEDQELLSRVGRKSITGILLIEKANPQSAPELHPLSPLAGAAGILSHTTASRCFDPPLLRSHLDFASDLVAEVSVQRLVYPHHPEAPGKIRALLARS